MSSICRVILIQPPFVQLNSPYPAPYYLRSFLEKRGLNVTVLDHSIGLFEKIFSRRGLEQIFADAARLYNTAHGADARRAKIIERFFSESELWIACIDRLIAFLRGRDPEWGHFLALANGCLPGGPRADACLANRGDLSPDEARILATRLLSDLADFITCTLDRGFSLIRYTPVMEGSLNMGFRDFSVVQKSLAAHGDSGYIMNSFYRPMLSEEWEKLGKDSANASGAAAGAAAVGGPFLLGLTIPFPGCLSGALICAESAKKHFGSAVRTVAGGGYVNTELRFLDTPDFFDYFDYVSFDRGYGSLVSVLEHFEAGEKSVLPPEKNPQIYKTMYRCPIRTSGGRRTVIAHNSIASSAAGHDMAVLEDEAARTSFPDYSAVDFGRYLYPVDDANPMHRLWSDGHWLKAYLAHGCYWHSCAFCDVGLDYIRNFIPVDTQALFTHLKSQAEKTGVRGVHLCDEAAPVSSLLEFALLNREAGLPLNFWGNIRFEKEFSPDLAAILAAGGLTGVSAGLEVATEKGFKKLGKGIDLESAVRACAAFKEAGILTHAYLIYGYWDEDEQELIDSAETLRQLFSNGLLDSAFWHKFVLTRHSRIYAEKKRGLHPGLRVKGDPAAPVFDPMKPDDEKSGACFALNDLSFAGEEKFDKYSEPLERLLGAWMKGETETPVTAAFPFRVKPPAIAPDLVAALLDKYARDRDNERARLPGNTEAPGRNVLFLGSLPFPSKKRDVTGLRWRWRLEERFLKTAGSKNAEKLICLLDKAGRRGGLDVTEFYSSLEETAGANAQKIWKYLKKNGLVSLRSPVDKKIF